MSEQDTKDKIHRVIYIHYSPTCWVALNKKETAFEDSSIDRPHLRQKHPKLKIITGADANKLMGLDDHGNRLFPDDHYEPKKKNPKTQVIQKKIIEIVDNTTSIKNEQIGDWKCICGVCLNEMPIAEWMPYSLFWKNYNQDKPLPHEDHPIPHLNSSHRCPHCNSHWEIIERLGTVDWVVDRYHNIVYLIGSPDKIKN